MFFLEQYKFVSKPIRDAAGLSNSSCVMPFHTQEWKQVAMCEAREPLEECIGRLPKDRRGEYRIISNMPENQ